MNVEAVPPDPLPELVIAISSRVLFDLDASHAVYINQGIEAYCQYQTEHEDDLLLPGVAFPLVRKLLNLNKIFDGRVSVKVVLMSRNSADTGLRIFNSIEHHQLDITRAAFTSGESPFEYAAALGAHLFLSTESQDVGRALAVGMAGATLLPLSNKSSSKDAIVQEQLRIAFDGDAVLFSDEAEQIYQSEGLSAFEASERASANTPLPGGPFKRFLEVLHQMQRLADGDSSPIRTALFTARGAPAHERVIRTLRDWGIRIDEALFLGGLDKGAFLRAFGADIFFDDQHQHCASTSKHVPTGHVPNGVVNG